MGIVSALVGIVGVIGQQKAAKKQAAAQREANAISVAGGDIRDRAARRRAAREERIRRARLLSASKAQGTTASSGELGGLAALNTNLNIGLASQESDRLAATGISAANQRAADASFQSESWQAWTKLIQGGIESYQNYQGT